MNNRNNPTENRYNYPDRNTLSQSQLMSLVNGFIIGTSLYGAIRFGSFSVLFRSKSLLAANGVNLANMIMRYQDNFQARLGFPEDNHAQQRFYLFNSRYDLNVSHGRAFLAGFLLGTLTSPIALTLLSDNERLVDMPRSLYSLGLVLVIAHFALEEYKRNFGANEVHINPIDDTQTMEEDETQRRRRPRS